MLRVRPPTPHVAAGDAGGRSSGPVAGSSLRIFAIPVHIAATAAPRQGRHGRDLVPCGSSLVAAVRAQAEGL